MTVQGCRENRVPPLDIPSFVGTTVLRSPKVLVGVGLSPHDSLALSNCPAD